MKCFLLAAVLAFTPTVAQAQPSLVILVRHAERDTTPPSDPRLTAAGEARAQALRDAVSQAGIGSVITTQYSRTRLTAKPLADSLGLTPIVVPAASPITVHVQAVAAAVRARPRGEGVLVVGHSNTIMRILAALGGPTLPDLCDNQYSNLFVIEMSSGSPRFIRASYGAADEPAAGCPAMR